MEVLAEGGLVALVVAFGLAGGGGVVVVVVAALPGAVHMVLAGGQGVGLTSLNIHFN